MTPLHFYWTLPEMLRIQVGSKVKYVQKSMAGAEPELAEVVVTHPLVWDGAGFFVRFTGGCPPHMLPIDRFDPATLVDAT